MASGQVKIEELPDDGRKSEEPRERDRPRQPKTEGNLRTRLESSFERLADTLEQRGDRELADIIREDGSVMAQGIVSLTRAATALRPPVLFVVAVLEPFLAFGRILRTLAQRWRARRYEQAEPPDEPPNPMATPPPVVP